LRNSELIYGKVKEIIDNKAVVLYAPDWAKYELEKYSNLIKAKAKLKNISEAEIDIYFLSFIRKLLLCINHFTRTSLKKLSKFVRILMRKIHPL